MNAELHPGRIAPFGGGIEKISKGNLNLLEKKKKK